MKAEDKISLPWNVFQKNYYFFKSYFSKDLNEKMFQTWNKFELGYYEAISLPESGNVHDPEDKCGLVLKKFYVDSKAERKEFIKYLDWITKFAYSEKNGTKTNLIVSIKNYSEDNIGVINVILSKKTKTLENSLGLLSEIDFLFILKKIVTLYFHLSEFSHLVELILKLKVDILNFRSIAYYRKIWTMRSKLPTYKIKIDLLNFSSPDKKILSNLHETHENFHITNLLGFIRHFSQSNELSLPLRHFCFKLEKKDGTKWENIASHPIFRRSIQKDKIDWEFWRIKKDEKDLLKKQNNPNLALRWSISKKKLIGKEMSIESESQSFNERSKTMKQKSFILLSQTEKNEKEKILNQELEEVQEILKSSKETVSNLKIFSHICVEDSNFIEGFLEEKNRSFKKLRYIVKSDGKELIKSFHEKEKKKNILEILMKYDIMTKEEFEFMLTMEKKVSDS